VRSPKSQNQIDCITILEIRSVERGICPIAQSIMTDTVIWCSCHNCWPIYSKQDCGSPS